MPADQALLDAVDTLWQIRPPGPENLWSSTAFVELKTLLVQRYANGRATFGMEVALGNVLRSLGIPCLQSRRICYQPLGLHEVASAIALQFERTTVRRRYLCPLDLAEDIPFLHFGCAKVGRFSAHELDDLFDAPRLARHFPDISLDTPKLSQFHWLVVDEDVDSLASPASRALPFLEMNLSADLGEINPYGGRFPPAVESALFFMLLAPWEQWAEMKSVDWRGFRLPWIYTQSDDLCVAPAIPPDPSALSWVPRTYTDKWGEPIELEEPQALPLDADAVLGIQELTDSKWIALQEAKKSELFETPVEHFLVRAFLAEGIDEVLAHLTVVEAALGLEADHRRKLRTSKEHSKLSSTQRVAARLSAALMDVKAAQDYQDLFDVRSRFVHGRAGLKPISTEHRVLARSLARRAAASLVGLASGGASRDVTMAQLLNHGVHNL